MDKVKKRSRLEFVFDIFKEDYNRAIKHKIYEFDFVGFNKSENQQKYAYYHDLKFLKYHKVYYEIEGVEIPGETPMNILFNFFIECDPSINKEYVSWFMNLYRNIIKNEIHDQHLEHERNDNNTFFEDLLSKVKGAIETFIFIKKTNALNVENRDINKFKTISEFIEVVKPYTIAYQSDDNEDIHTLNRKELACIKRFTNKDGGSGSAELVFENDKWLIAVTHDKPANIEFGKYTTWCTAGNRYQDMFTWYHTRGTLFVLIRKGFGSKLAITNNPEYRLQFHFETNQYMDANNQSIDIASFFKENIGVKEYFIDYLTTTALPLRLKKESFIGNIKYLIDLGYADNIIDMVKKSNPISLNLTNCRIDSKYLLNIGCITSLTELDLSNCDLDALPESIKLLKNLKSLKFSGNSKVTTIPSWINDIEGLEYLDCSNCDIDTINNVVENKNIKNISLDYNKRLKYLPSDIGKLNKLTRITATSCDLRDISEDIINCKNLTIFDVHMNKRLEKIPLGLSKLEHMVAINFDDTKISFNTKKLMENDSNGNVYIIKYE